MNILIDIRPLMSPRLSGVGEYTYHLVDSMIRIGSGHRFFLWSNSYADLTGTVWERAALPWGRLGMVTLCHSHWPNKVLHSSMAFFAKPRMERMIGFSEGGKQKIDVVFMPNMHFFAVAGGTRLVVAVHDMSFEIYPEFFTWKDRARHALVVRKILRRANVVIAVSENTKRDLVDVYGVHDEKIEVVYPGLWGMSAQTPPSPPLIKGRTLSEKYHLPEKYILFLGTLEPRKNVAGLVQAYEALLRKDPHSPDLVIAGLSGWHQAPIVEQVERSPHRARIHMAGYIDPSDKQALYQSAELFVYPSFYEGFGFPPLEALAAGTPAIVGVSGSLPEVVGDAALLVDPYNIQELSEAMLQALRDDGLRATLRERGFEAVKKYQWDESAQKVLDVLTL